MQDRAEVFCSDDRIVIAVADGGGCSGGAMAAETFIFTIMEACKHLTTAEQCSKLLLQIDATLAGGRDSGETTGVVTAIDRQIVFGATAGDSGARLYIRNTVSQLAPADRTKPLIGSGSAFVQSFAAPMSGTLVVATDGLWKYAKPAAIQEKVSLAPSEKLAAELGNLPRLPSGTLPDDIAIVTYRSSK